MPFKHGGKGTRLYRIWCGMRRRCNCETCRRDEPDGDYLYERARDRRMEKETW